MHHKLNVCIGLPNKTGNKWQVGDSSEQNGQSWKTEMAREKGKLVLYKTRIEMETTIYKSDAIPLINLAWPKSFSRTSTNQNAIRDQGWYPANQKLLQDPEILKTKTSSTSGSDNSTNPRNPPDESTGRRTNSSNPTDAATTQQPTLLVTTTGPTDDVSEIYRYDQPTYRP